MREINRKIVSAIIISKDNKILMGGKDPKGGGVFPNFWHLPGGGKKEGESLEATVTREIEEEVGIDISPYKITPIPFVDNESAEKIIKGTSEKVMCNMEFNRFEVIVDKNADEIKLILGDDLIEARWFDMNELELIEQVPGGRVLFQKMGYIK